MNKTNLGKFKRLFEEQKTRFHQNPAQKMVTEDLSLQADEHIDEVDHASYDIEQSMRIQLRNRHLMDIQKIQDALDRIEEGTFGECESCGEDIELRRIQAHPTALLCVACQEEEERFEMLRSTRRSHANAGAVSF